MNDTVNVEKAFALKDRSVLNWEGVNYVPQTELAAQGAQDHAALATLCAVMMTPPKIEPGYVNQNFNALADAIRAAGYHR
jgi:hypothetical protein